jgi:hypothetical protein
MRWNDALILKLRSHLLVALITVTAFSAVSNASDRHQKSKSKALPRLSPGPAWADTNKDGQLSDEEAKRAAQILQDKIKKAKTETTKAARK